MLLRKTGCIVCVAIVLFVAWLPFDRAFAATVVLKDGSRMTGTLVSKTDAGVTLRTEYGDIFINSSDLAVTASPEEAGSQKNNIPVVRGKKKTSVAVQKPSKWAGKTRTGTYQGLGFTLYLPSVYSVRSPCPLIVGIDPEGDGRAYLSSWREIAEEHGYAVLSPIKKGKWAMQHEESVSALIKYIVSVYAIDKRNVFLTGFETGGTLGYFIITEHRRLITAFAPIATEMPNPIGEISLSKSAHTPILIVHGELDEVVPLRYARRAYETLKKYNYRMKYYEVPRMYHENRQEETAHIMDFFEKYRRK